VLVPENRRLRTYVGLNTGELEGDFCGNGTLTLGSSGTGRGSLPEAFVCFNEAGKEGLGIRAW
jgi:hypothetical protein